MKSLAIFPLVVLYAVLYTTINEKPTGAYSLKNHRSPCILFQKKIRSTFFANPVNQDGSSFRGDITEEEAFLWFDEAFVYVRGGSGGAGASTFKYGKSRQHAAV